MHVVTGRVQVIAELFDEIVKGLGKVGRTSAAAAKPCHHAARELVETVDEGAGHSVELDPVHRKEGDQHEFESEPEGDRGVHL